MTRDNYRTRVDYMYFVLQVRIIMSLFAFIVTTLCYCGCTSKTKFTTLNRMQVMEVN